MRLLGYDILLKKVGKKASGDAGRELPFGFFAPRKERLVFSQSEILDCLKMISNRLGNVVFSCEQGRDFIAVKEIFAFVQDNRLQFVRRMFYDGFVVVNTKTNEFVSTAGRVNFKSFADDLMYFRLEPNEVILLSETLEATGLSDFQILQDKLRFLDAVNSSDFNLIENYGAMGIVSPESDNSVTGAEFSEDDIADLQARYKKSYGIRFGKWALMFVPRPTKFTPITLPIAQLQLGTKRTDMLKAIYSALEIPKEVSVYFESAKYANRNEAELDFYSNTIAKWANAEKRLIEKMYEERRKHSQALLPNTFWYDFVGVLALEDARRAERERAKAEYDFWVKIRQNEPTQAATAEERIRDLITNL